MARELTLDELQNKVDNFRNARNWNRSQSPKNLAMSIAIEAAELMEIYQWISCEDSAKVTDQKVLEHIGEEIADIMIYCLTLLSELKMSPTEIIEDKMIKNGIKYPIK